jgi:hypothetical protein
VRYRQGFLAGALALAVLQAGCAGGGSHPIDPDELVLDPVPAVATDEESFDAADEPSRLEPSRVSVTLGGDVDLTWEGDVDLRVVRLTPEERAVHLVSVGLEDAVPAGDGRWLRFAFDLVGGYDGDGTYEIPAVTGDARDAVSSNAFVVVAETGAADLVAITPEDVEETLEFTAPRSACVVELTDGERSGSLECPDLAALDGGRVALRVVWGPLPG